MATDFTVDDLLNRAARMSPGKHVIISDDQRWTYGELHQRVDAFSSYLEKEGFQAGELVGISLENCPEYIVAILGMSRIGLTPVLFPFEWPAGQVVERAQLMGMKSIILAESSVVRNQASFQREIVQSGISIVPLGNGTIKGNDFRNKGRSQEPSRPFVVVFSAGLSGNSKSCYISHSSLLAKCEPFSRILDFTSESRLWVGLPMSQIAFILSLVGVLYARAALVGVREQTAKESRSTISRHRVTHAFPFYLTRWQPIVEGPEFWPSEFKDLSHLCLVGPYANLRRMQRALPQCTIITSYGSAETGGFICLSDEDEPLETRLGSCGRVLPEFDIRVVDRNMRDPLPAGAIGELQVRSDHFLRGIDTPAQGSTFTADGWLVTEDLGHFDREGRLYYHGRIADQLYVGTEVASALTLEAAVSEHPAIAQAQFAMRMRGREDVIALYVELRPGFDLSPEEIVEFCATRMKRQFVPRMLAFVTNWPVSASKIYKKALAEMPVDWDDRGALAS